MRDDTSFSDRKLSEKEFSDKHRRNRMKVEAQEESHEGRSNG